MIKSIIIALIIMTLMFFLFLVYTALIISDDAEEQKERNRHGGEDGEEGKDKKDICQSNHYFWQISFLFSILADLIYNFPIHFFLSDHFLLYHIGKN